MSPWLRSYQSLAMMPCRAGVLPVATEACPGAVNVSKDKWTTLQGLHKDKVNVLYCYTQTCHLAAQAAEWFAAKGYPVVEMEGGFAAWKAADLEIETAATAQEFAKAA